MPSVSEASFLRLFMVFYWEENITVSSAVLATLDFVKVHQAEAYAEILISRGPKM